MKIERRVVEGVGANGRRLPLTWYRRSDRAGDGTEHLALVFPGRVYGCDMPLFYYARKVLLESGADVCEVSYDYADLFQATDPDQWVAQVNQRLAIDVGQAMTAAASVRPRRLTLVGKSLGTRAMAHALDGVEGLGLTTPVRLIGLTPLLKDDQVRTALLAHTGPALYVIGSRDEHYDREFAERIHDHPKSRLLTIEGADHGLEIDDDLRGSIKALSIIVSAMHELTQLSDEQEGRRS